MIHARQIRLALIFVLLASALSVMSATATPGDNSERSSETIKLERASPDSDATGPPSAPAAAAMRYGALPADPAALAAGKLDAQGRIGADNDDTPTVVSPKPVKTLAWEGVRQVGIAPSDSTGAIGTTRYVESVNSRVAIYNRAGTQLAIGGLGPWWNMGSANVFDPQVIWDPTTNRFYYTGDAVFGDTDNRLAYGFSKTASPTNLTTDWCKYQVEYGVDFPDYPKLGDSRDFALIGVNVFSPTSFIGSDIIGIGKPGAGTTCPDGSSFAFGIATDLNVGGVTQFTPVPANQTDTNGFGWVLTRPASVPASTLGLFKVSKNLDGSPNIQSVGNNITVPSYSLPANAPQSGSPFLLDSSDTRLTQAVSAVDPSRANRVGIWTQHTVFGGAGAMVRWYQINPLTRSVIQTGIVQSPTLFIFNAAISPDRVVRGTTRAFGSNMVIGFNTSSSTTFPTIAMASKRGVDTRSGFVTIKVSPGPNIDFTCQAPPNSCRWGDYAAATPDPAAPTTGATGQVWLTNQWNANGTITGVTTTAWKTWNWAAKP